MSAGALDEDVVVLVDELVATAIPRQQGSRQQRGQAQRIGAPRLGRGNAVEMTLDKAQLPGLPIQIQGQRSRRPRQGAGGQATGEEGAQSLQQLADVGHVDLPGVRALIGGAHVLGTEITAVLGVVLPLLVLWMFMNRSRARKERVNPESPGPEPSIEEQVRFGLTVEKQSVAALARRFRLSQDAVRMLAPAEGSSSPERNHFPGGKDVRSESSFPSPSSEATLHHKTT